MAFINDEGMHISYNCSGLITKLKKDIAAYGGDKFVDVIVEKYGDLDAIIYKDYVMHKDGVTLSDLDANKSWKCMTASALLTIYEAQNSVL